MTCVVTTSSVSEPRKLSWADAVLVPPAATARKAAPVISVLVLIRNPPFGLTRADRCQKGHPPATPADSNGRSSPARRRASAERHQFCALLSLGYLRSAAVEPARTEPLPRLAIVRSPERFTR